MIKLRHQRPSLWHRGLAKRVVGTVDADGGPVAGRRATSGYGV
jgi:hypothetical protein